MHRPASFQDMILLAERADQAYIADKNGVLQSRSFSGFSGYSNCGGFGNGGRGQNSNVGGR